jgi:branched-chain amino acid transport system permease protein
LAGDSDRGVARLSGYRLAIPDRSRLPDLPGDRRRARPHAADGLCRAGLAWPCRSVGRGRIHRRPTIAGKAITDPRAWYFILLAAAAATLIFCANLLRARSGRAWAAIRANETVAEALGIDVASYKLLAFVVSSALTAVAGALFAYYRGFVSVEVFSLFLSIQYVAMIIIGGMGSLLGAILGAIFVTLFPYVIEAAVQALPGARRYAGLLFAVNYSAFGVVMILFLVLEPQGLVGMWRRIQSYLLLWPFKHRPAAGARK